MVSEFFRHWHLWQKLNLNVGSEHLSISLIKHGHISDLFVYY